MVDSSNKNSEIFIHNRKIDEKIFSEQLFESNNPNITFNSTNEKYFVNRQTSLLNKKRKDNYNTNSSKKHTKYSFDNLKRECKHLVIESVLKFINNKISEVYEGNIGDGIKIKKLFKLNQSQKKNADVEFNKIFITKTLKEILSQNITKKILLYDPDHNKKVIEKIILEKKDKFEKLFNLTFIECLEHFIGEKNIEELNGITLFTELKEPILKKYEKDGESYYENLKKFLKGYESIIKQAKPRKKRIEASIKI